jgi:hypothetical protein
MEASRQRDGASRDGTTILYCTPHPKFDCGVLSGQSEGCRILGVFGRCLYDLLDGM